MAIPIKEYIGIQENAVVAEGGVELVGLVISSADMVTGDSHKADYDAGKVVTLSKDEAVAAFTHPSTETAAVAAAKHTLDMMVAYGAYKVKVIKKSTTYLAAFQSACAQDGSFGAFAIDAASDEEDDIAAYNQGLGAQHLFVAADSTAALTNKYLLKVNVYNDQGTESSGDDVADDFKQIGAVLGWASAIDHVGVNGASTLMYKDLGVDATVYDLATKQTYDAADVNYCGLVQTHGPTRKFFQMGRCADGMDAGVAMSSIYMTASIENAWIALAMGATKIPANADGSSQVLGLVLGVAENAVTNGAILVDKPLTQAQQRQIVEFTKNEAAIVSVQTTGYYANAEIRVVGSDYVCVYTLVYAKGDHIAKVSGSHVLV